MEQCSLCTEDKNGAASPHDSSLLHRKYKKEVQELMEKGYLPNNNEEKPYDVFIIRKTPVASHWSVVVTYDNNHFISIHLDFVEEEGKHFLYPLVETIDKKRASKFELVGQVTMKGEDLMSAAWLAMVEFGRYNAIYKNCQDFCTRYLENIGLKCPLTDFGNIKRVAFSSAPCLASPEGPRSSTPDESVEGKSGAEANPIPLRALDEDIQKEAEKSLLGSPTQTAGMHMTKKKGNRRPETKYTPENA